MKLYSVIMSCNKCFSMCMRYEKPMQLRKAKFLVENWKELTSNKSEASVGCAKCNSFNDYTIVALDLSQYHFEENPFNEFRKGRK